MYALPRAPSRDHHPDQSKHYGWRYALYISAVLYACMVAAGVTVHFLFAGLGLVPTVRPQLEEMIAFRIDYTFWLNLAFGALAAVLMWLHLRGARRHGGDAHHGHPPSR